MLDLSLHDTLTPSNEGAWFTPIGLDGSPIGIRIRLLGPDSDEYVRAADEKARELAQRMIAARSNDVAIKGDDLSAEATIKTLARITTAWEPLATDESVTWQGEEFPCTQENAAKLYRHVPYLREQADRFASRRANFTRSSPATSVPPAEQA